VPLYTDFRSPDAVVTDAAAINDAIKNILLTDIGSVPGNPTFGSNIAKTLFSQLDHITISILKTQISDALAKWENRIYINDVTVREIPEYNKVVIDISYQYADAALNINETVSVAFVQ